MTVRDWKSFDPAGGQRANGRMVNCSVAVAAA
jgi:hypothetical protein